MIMKLPFLVCKLSLLFATSHLFFPNLANSQSNTPQAWPVQGLQNDAQIVVDTWGIPHIYAKNEADLFFTQGFNAARDRLFQIDLWRRRGLGQLSEVFGATFLEQDRAARLFLYRDDMKKEWRAYGVKSEQITESFVAGINAYVDYVTKNPQALPQEFKVLNYLPAKWQAQDVVRIRSHGLTRNLTSEVARSKLACAGKLALDEVRAGLSPEWKTKIPAGLNPCLPENLLRQFTLATQNVAFDPIHLKMAQVNEEPAPLSYVTTQTTQTTQDSENLEGSNNWVIAPSKSSTGRPIMANDPHRAYSAPSLRYITHLSAPGINVIGAGEPALPGISIGHNGTIAFGLTIMSIDQEDLYVYETNPANPLQYKYQGQWENMTKLTETFLVRGEQAMTSNLMFTRHGPVIFSEPESKRAFAVRTGWLQAGMAPYFGSIDYMRATTFDQFKKSMLHWGAPTENQVYADVKGNIGWVPGGLTPIRPNWDGLMPVPGDGRYEWAGFLSGDKLPFSYNPKAGWFASANELNLPKNYPYKQRKIGFEWANMARYDRIAEVLSQDKKISIEDSMQLQNDVLSLPAQRLLRLLLSTKPIDEKSESAIKYLKQWDFQEHANSGHAALYQVWLTQFLGPAYKERMLGDQSTLVSTAPDLALMLKSLESTKNFPQQFGKNPKTVRDELLVSTLSLAYQQMEIRLGIESANWHWGDLQKTLFAHPFSSMLDTTNRSKVNVGPIARGGSATTVNQSSYRLSDFLQLNGPSFRVIVDVGNWDNSRAVNAPGQSGDPANPHYRALADKWAKGEYFPLLYSRKAIDGAAEQVFNLVPLK
jgi:penicillin amidase